MTFHPIFGNHREKYASDCGTITYLNARSIQFLGSLMDNRLSLVFKRCGLESGTFIIYDFFLFVYLFIFFLILCVNGYFNVNLQVTNHLPPKICHMFTLQIHTIFVAHTKISLRPVLSGNILILVKNNTPAF